MLVTYCSIASLLLRVPAISSAALFPTYAPTFWMAVLSLSLLV
jgi:hypothetical protein